MPETFETVQQLIDHINGQLGMIGVYVHKNDHRGELLFYSPTNTLLFKIILYRSDVDGWQIGGGGLLLYPYSLVPE